MTPRTAALLEESIQHWERVVEFPDLEMIGTGSCALCREFNPLSQGSVNHNVLNGFQENKALGCQGCPVLAKTGRSFCRGTPYERVEDLDRDRTSPLYLAAAQDELAFLKSLREEVK